MPIPFMMGEEVMSKTLLSVLKEQGIATVFALALLVLCSLEAFFYQKQTIIMQQQVDLTARMVEAHHDMLVNQRTIEEKEEVTAKAIAAAVDVQNRFIQAYAMQQDAERDRLKAIEDELRADQGRRR